MRWEPERALRSPSARNALRELGKNLADAGFVNRFERFQIGDERDADLAKLAVGRAIDVHVAARFLGGPHALKALIDTGLAMITESSRFSLSVEVLSDGRAMAILPFLDRADDVPIDSVYAGSDTWLLRDHAWRYARPGSRAVDLGTGSGLLAAFLTSRFETVIATDINERAARTALLSRELLPEPSRSRMHVVLNDVAAGLQPETFDFVCVNSPWLPTARAGARLYAHGGLTGFELPQRFISQGAALLAEGGILVALCAELSFVDGSNPLRELLTELEGFGFSTEIDPTPPDHPFHTAADATAVSNPRLRSARHVTVIVKRNHA